MLAIKGQIANKNRHHSADYVQQVKIGTASTNTLASYQLDTKYANYQATCIRATSGGSVTEYAVLPVCAVTSAGVLTIAESSDGFSDNDEFWVAIHKDALAWAAPTMSTP